MDDSNNYELSASALTLSQLSRQIRRYRIRAVTKALKRFCKQLILPGFKLEFSGVLPECEDDVLCGGYDIDDNHGVPYPGGTRTLSDAMKCLLADKYDDYKEKPLHLITSPTQSTKSAIQQILLTIYPMLEWLNNGKKKTVYPIAIIPNLEKHEKTMFDEIRLRAALMSCLSVVYQRKKYKVIDYYRNKLHIGSPNQFDRVVQRTHQFAADRMVKDTNTIVLGAFDALIKKLCVGADYSVFAALDEPHYGSAENGIWSKLQNKIRDLNVEHTLVAVDATPTEFLQPKVYGLIHHIAGWIDPGYQSFFIGDINKKTGECLSEGRVIYRFMPGALKTHHRLPLCIVDEECRAKYGLGPKETLEPEYYRNQVETGNDAEEDGPYGRKHLLLLKRVIKRMMVDNDIIMIRVDRKQPKEEMRACQELSAVINNNPEIAVINLGDPKVVAQHKKFRSIRDIQDYYYMKGMKVITIIVDRCKMAHRYHKLIDIAIDLAPANKGDESVKQSFAARLSGYKTARTRLLLTNRSYEIHKTIQDKGVCYEEDRCPARRLAWVLENGKSLYSNHSNCLLWNEEWTHDPMVTFLFSSLTARLQSDKNVIGNVEDTANYFSNSVLDAIMRKHVADVTGLSIASIGQEVESKNRAGEHRFAGKDWSFRHGTKATFHGIHDPAGKAKNNGETKNSLIWHLSDNMKYKNFGGRNADQLYTISQADGKYSPKGEVGITCGVLRSQLFGNGKGKKNKLTKAELEAQEWFNYSNIRVVGTALPLAKIDYMREQRELETHLEFNPTEKNKRSTLIPMVIEKPMPLYNGLVQ
jgi:hypothetical protein